MRDPIKLRDSIIIGGLQYNRESIVDRSLVRGTRFDSPEYCIESDDPEFHEPPWNDRVEVSTELEQNITGGETDPMMERIARRKVIKQTVVSPPPTEDEIVRPRFPEGVIEEEIEEEVRPKKVLLKKKLIRKR